MSALEQLQKAFPQATLLGVSEFGPSATLTSAEWLASAQTLKTKLGFDVLEDATALDQGEHFQLVLHLTRSKHSGEHCSIKTQVLRTQPEIASLSGVYRSAEWYEREIFDMFGIKFLNHPDLRRILLPPEWQGYPLRKDYTDTRILKRPGAGA